MSFSNRFRAVVARLNALFVDREIFLLADGRVRFVRVSRAWQLRLAGVAAVTIVAVAVVLIAAVIGQVRAAGERAALADGRAAVAREAASVAAYKGTSGNVVDDLERRQRIIEELVTDRLGTAPVPGATPAARKTSALPDARALASLAARQDAFAANLAAAFDARSTGLSSTLRKLGFDPDRLVARRRTAQGGPLARWPADGTRLTPALARLAASVERWSLLEDNVVAMPSSLPADATPVTSSYGVRSDPFTGAAAYHAGLDFVGSYGQPILAAAPGRVAFVGQRSGYGNVVEIDHGNGVTTRYAHLSRFDVRVGAAVGRRQRIAQMGSTGRSTGVHLHFEVRLNGAAVNPRRFLSLNQEIADVQHARALG